MRLVSIPSGILCSGLLAWLCAEPARRPLAVGQDPPQKSPRYDQRSKADAEKRPRNDLVPLTAAGVRKGSVVEIALTVGMRIHEIDADSLGKQKDRIRTRSYNSGLCGPVIRVRPGDQLRVHLKNDIRRTEPDQPYDPARPTAPHGLNVTNMHTHGLNVSPQGRSDNVFLEVGPEEALDLCFDIPADHPCGTFWYHAHKHGSVALQLAGGMAGVLIVEGGTGSLDDDPAVRAATAAGHEKVIVFQQIPYTPDPDGKVVEVKAEDVYATQAEKSLRALDGTLPRRTLVNGEVLPTIAMRPGEVQRWRCLHAGLEQTLDLALVKAEGGAEPADGANRYRLHEIAVDGLPLGTLEAWTHVELQPGYRSDLLVESPPPGMYYLMGLPLPHERSITGRPEGPVYLARVEVAGVTVSPKMTLPSAKDLVKYPAQQGLTPIDKVDVSRPEFVFRRKDDTEAEFWVNGEPYTSGHTLFRPALGTAEEWTLVADWGRHPFHVHVNPFQVSRKNEAGDSKMIWRDTVFITEDDAEATKIRMRFNKFGGRTVLHCHNLRHEDQGMMAAFEIVGKDTVPGRCPEAKAGFDRLPAPAPAWEVPDATGKARTSAEFKGKKVLLVLSRGSDCVHCREQIQLLAKRENAKRLGNAGLAVVVVAPVPPRDIPGGGEEPFTTLSDERRAVFKDYRCHDGRALHGTFLIDSAGNVRWQDVGDEPYMDIAALLERAGDLK